MQHDEIPPDPMSKPGEPRYYWQHHEEGEVVEEKVASEAFRDWGGPNDPATMYMKIGAIFEVLTFDQRQRVLAQLGFKPVQRFYDEQSGAVIKFHRYYGFCDAGGLAGSFDGYATEAEAIAEIKKVYPEYIANAVQAGYPEVSTDPAQLGAEWCVVITGEQFVAQLRKLGEPLSSTYGVML